MSLAQFLLFGLSVLILIGLLWLGRKEERIAALGFLALMVGSPLVQDFEVGNIRWAVALLSAGLLLVLLGLVATSRRWWLIAAAGFQMATTTTYLIAMVQQGASNSVRLGVIVPHGTVEEPSGGTKPWLSWTGSHPCRPFGMTRPTRASTRRTSVP